jgi:molecular chaperone GrpE
MVDHDDREGAPREAASSQSSKARQSSDRDAAERSGSPTHPQADRGRAFRGSERRESPDEEALRAEVEALQAAHQRLAADFENYKRHSRKEAETARQLGRDRLVRNLTSVLGELTSAGRAEGQDADSLRHGIQLIRQKLDSVLSELDYERIESVGMQMDPNLHEAVAVVPAQSEGQKGKVIEEIAPGYRRGRILIQPARVVVAR